MHEAVQAYLAQLKFSRQDVEQAKARIEDMVNEYRTSEFDTTDQLEMAKVDEKLDNLTDALIDRLIGKDEYERRKQRLILSRQELQQRIANSRTFAQKAAEVRTILELVNSVAQAYEMGNRAEQRQIIKWAFSNCEVEAKNTYFRPSNRLQWAENAISVLSSAHAPTSSRTFDAAFLATIEKLELLEKENDGPVGPPLLESRCSSAQIQLESPLDN